MQLNNFDIYKIMQNIETYFCDAGHQFDLKLFHVNNHQEKNSLASYFYGFEDRGYYIQLYIIEDNLSISVLEDTDKQESWIMSFVLVNGNYFKTYTNDKKFETHLHEGLKEHLTIFMNTLIKEEE